MIELAKNLEKPLVVHARMAEAEVLELARDVDTVIYHCYSGSVETMKEIVDAGYYISLATLVCFSEHHQTLAAEVPPLKTCSSKQTVLSFPRAGGAETNLRLLWIRSLWWQNIRKWNLQRLLNLQLKTHAEFSRYKISVVIRKRESE